MPPGPLGPPTAGTETRSRARPHRAPPRSLPELEALGDAYPGLMFEVLLNQPKSRHLSVSAETTDAMAETSASIVMRTGLVWAEHCTECAWPTCYSTCSLYTPRADLNCRRFEEGIVPVVIRPGAGSTGRAMRVSFRQWGKLEAHGRPTLAPSQRLKGVDLADRALRSALRTRVAGEATRRRAGDVYSARVRPHLGPAGEVPNDQDIFLLEAINEGSDAVQFTLTVLEEGVTAQQYQSGFVLDPGYNRIEFSAADVAARVDLCRSVFVRIEPMVVVPGNSFVFITADFARLDIPIPLHERGATSHPGPATLKCVVWDLDNTVWRGTLIEDGPDALAVRPEVVEIVQALDARGILQSVASKNNAEDALPVLERAGLLEYMLVPHISWEPKSQAVRSIANTLDIGIDSLMFVDDQEFERAEVLAAHPSVRVVDAADLANLLDREEFDLPVTEESRRRRSMYTQEFQRRAVLAEAPTDFNSFLRGCDVQMRLTSPSPDNAERLYELTQRTNQLNYSGNRLDRREVEAIVSGDSPLTGVVMSVSDRFGDYGVVGFVTVDTSTFTVTNFFMSCRAQRKKVEDAFFSTLLESCRRSGFDELLIRYKATPRNGPALEVLRGLGAAPVMRGAGGDTDPVHEVMYSMSSSQTLSDADIVSVDDEVVRFWN